MEESLKCLKCGCPVIVGEEHANTQWRCPVCHSKYMLQCINGKLSFNE